LNYRAFLHCWLIRLLGFSTVADKNTYKIFKITLISMSEYFFK
jgi:hypothetical protein